MIALLLALSFLSPSSAAPNLVVTEQCFAEGAGRMSYYPEPGLKRCGETPKLSISGEVDLNELPDDPIASETGAKLAIKYLQSAVAVTIDGHEVLRIDDPGGVDNPIDAAYWHGKDWIVEGRGKIFVNGKRTSPGPILSTSFYYRMLNDKPFFFFQRPLGSVRLSYSGVIQKEQYDQVAFGLCCEPGFANPRHSKDSVQFFGKRGSTWYLVTAKAVEGHQ